LLGTIHSEKSNFKTRLLESFKGKEMIAQKARNPQPSIREHALVALQKIMIQNWSMMTV